MEVSLLFLYPLGYFFFLNLMGRAVNIFTVQVRFICNYLIFSIIRSEKYGLVESFTVSCFILVVVALKIYNFELFQDCLQRHIQTTRQKSKIDFFDRALNTSLVYIGMIVIPMNVLFLLQISKMVGKLSVLVNHLQYMQPPLRRKQSGWHTFPNV